MQLMRARRELLDDAGACPDDLIREAEERLGQPFPPSYRAFLAAMGTATFGGQEIYGLIPGRLEGQGIPNALWLYERNVADLAQPTRYFEFYDYGDGTTVALDLDHRDSDGECALAMTHAGAWSEHAEPVNGDFGMFLLDLVRNHPADD